MTWRWKVLLVSIPAAFDLFATAFCCIGILYIPASIWQMLRGSDLVFAVLLSIVFLKRKMFAFNWLGLFLCVVGICLVGLANVWGGSEEGPTGNDTASVIFGTALVLFGQVVQAGQ